MTGPPFALSALVIAKNEEEMLDECLATLRFAAEIVVVDSGSADRTVAIAEAAGARVLRHDFETHAKQKNWGIGEVRHDWVLVVDADERVPPALAEEIVSLLASNPSAPGYWIRRRNTFLGRRIRGAGWGRDKVLRLFNRRRASYAERLVHEEVATEGLPGTLFHSLDHHPCRDLSEWVEKTNRYAMMGAKDAYARGRRAGMFAILLRPPARFLKQYVLQAGFRDGTEGFLLCVIAAFGVFLKVAKLRELGRRRP